jgi:hypothetical protein
MMMLKWFAPALMERINVGIQTQKVLGRKIVEDAGGIGAPNTLYGIKVFCIDLKMWKQLAKSAAIHRLLSLIMDNTERHILCSS